MRTTPFAIRPARSDEAQALVDIWLRSVRATHSFVTEAEIATYLPLVRTMFDQRETWVLCEASDQAIGFMAMNESEVDALFLSPEYLRRGGGRMLIDHARRLKGPLTVDVSEENPDALHFYLACGFEIIGRSELDGLGHPHPLLHLRDRAEL
jgi:putative acetyltransferase